MPVRPGGLVPPRKSMHHLVLVLLLVLYTSLTSAATDSSTQQHFLFLTPEKSLHIHHREAQHVCSKYKAQLPPLSTHTEMQRLTRTLISRSNGGAVKVWYQQCVDIFTCYLDNGGDNPVTGGIRQSATHIACYKGVGLSRGNFTARTAAGTLFLTDQVTLLDRNFSEAKTQCSVYGKSVTLPPYLGHDDQYLHNFRRILDNIHQSFVLNLPEEARTFNHGPTAGHGTVFHPVNFHQAVGAFRGKRAASNQNQVAIQVWIDKCVSAGTCYSTTFQTLHESTFVDERISRALVCFNDTDECSSPLTHNCDGTTTVCVNTIGSYRCDCNVKGGYVKVNGHKGCLSAQACATSTYGCRCQCQNGGQCPNGTEYCNCPAGFTGRYCDKTLIRFSDWSYQTQGFTTEKKAAESWYNAYYSNSGFPGCFEMRCPFENGTVNPFYYDESVRYALWPAVISIGDYRRPLSIIYHHRAYYHPTCRLHSPKCLNNPLKLSCNYTEVGQDIRCHCPKGRTGPFCTKTDICEQQNPCQHGGTCVMVNSGDHYKCFCPQGYNGQHCQNAYGNTCAVHSTNGHVTASIFWFRPSDSNGNRLVTRSYAESIDICSRHGADILHFIPDSCRFQLPYGGVYANRDPNTQVTATHYNVTCQYPIQVCPAFGTLQVPLGHHFNASVTYAEAERLCHQTAHFEIPWAFHTSQECMQRLLVRMQTLFGLDKIPKVWWAGDKDKPEMRKVVCYVAQSNEHLPGVIQTCDGYGTLQTASNVDFRTPVSFVKAQQICQDAGGQQVPWAVPGAVPCMARLLLKMRQFLDLPTLPRVWWSEDATRDGLRHVVCWIPQSNNGYTVTWPNLPLVSNFSSTTI